MNKQEKYYSHILDDLIENTQFDFENYTYKKPFGIGVTKTLSRGEVDRDFAYNSISFNSTTSFFANHLRSRYGVREDELMELLVRYFNKIHDLRGEYLDKADD